MPNKIIKGGKHLGLIKCRRCHKERLDWIPAEITDDIILTECAGCEAEEILKLRGAKE